MNNYGPKSLTLWRLFFEALHSRENNRADFLGVPLNFSIEKINDDILEGDEFVFFVAMTSIISCLQGRWKEAIYFKNITKFIERENYLAGASSAFIAFGRWYESFRLTAKEGQEMSSPFDHGSSAQLLSIAMRKSIHALDRFERFLNQNPTADLFDRQMILFFCLCFERLFEEVSKRDKRVCDILLSVPWEEYDPDSIFTPRLLGLITSVRQRGENL